MFIEKLILEIDSMVEEKDIITGKASEEKIICKVCGKEFENYRSFGDHLRVHKITSKEYYDKFFKKEGEGICLVCGKETTFISLKRGYHKFCSRRCVNKGEYNPNYGKHRSEETKKKISDAKKGKMTGEKNPNYGKHLSEETKKKISDAHKGKHCSEETKKRISDTEKGKHCSEETKRKISDAQKGKHLSEETKKKMSDAKKGKMAGEKNPMYGKHHTEEVKKRISYANKGENHPNYKGGISLKEFKDTHGIELEEWKKLAQEIRKRDNFTCQLCGKKGATDVHHIIPRRIKIDNSPDNLITLCRSCHGKVEHLTDIYLSEGKDPREIFFNKKF
jgi:hypothetical protein